jgi:hypothetical protein
MTVAEVERWLSPNLGYDPRAKGAKAAPGGKSAAA